jgi:hypothetical protein
MARIDRHTITDAWQRAADCGWDSEQITEAFAFLALTVFTAYFLNYAQTPLDLPDGPAAAGQPE